MIKREDIYVFAFLITCAVCFYIYTGNKSPIAVQRARIDAIDSIITSQRDFHLAQAKYHLLLADSLDAIAKRKAQDTINIKSKYDQQKINLLNLPPDSILKLFTSHAQH